MTDALPYLTVLAITAVLWLALLWLEGARRRRGKRWPR